MGISRADADEIKRLAQAHAEEWMEDADNYDAVQWRLLVAFVDSLTVEPPDGFGETDIVEPSSNLPQTAPVEPPTPAETRDFRLCPKCTHPKQSHIHGICVSGRNDDAGDWMCYCKESYSVPSAPGEETSRD